MSGPVGLRDLYGPDELGDREDGIGWVLEEYGEDLLDELFEPRRVPAAELRSIISRSGGSPVVEAFRAHAKPWQRELVRDKMARFDENRVLVVLGEVLVDGHHHLIAAHRLGRDALVIDLEDPAPAPADGCSEPEIG